MAAVRPFCITLLLTHCWSGVLGRELFLYYDRGCGGGGGKKGAQIPPAWILTESKFKPERESNLQGNRCQLWAYWETEALTPVGTNSWMSPNPDCGGGGRTVFDATISEVENGVSITGLCKTQHAKQDNQVYTLEGTTADGRPYYKSESVDWVVRLAIAFPIVVIIVATGCCCYHKYRQRRQVPGISQTDGQVRYINVQCPAGMKAGQMLQVQDPATGQTFQAEVPAGTPRGGTFRVQAPQVGVIVGAPTE